MRQSFAAKLAYAARDAARVDLAKYNPRGSNDTRGRRSGFDVEPVSGSRPLVQRYASTVTTPALLTRISPLGRSGHARGKRHGVHCAGFPRVTELPM